MDTLRQAIAHLGIGLIVALVGLWLARRFVPRKTLGRYHAQIDAVYATMAAAFGVLVSFVIVMSWEQFRQARETTAQEAASLANLFHMANGFDPAVRDDLRSTIAAYVATVLDEEWPLLSTGGESSQAWAHSNRLWTLYTSVPPADRERSEHAQSLAQMRELQDLRSRRLMQSRNALPAVLWMVLYVGAIITVGFTFLFVVEHGGTQAALTTVLVIVVAGSLFLVAALENPYEGSISVQPTALRNLQGLFTAEPQR